MSAAPSTSRRTPSAEIDRIEIVSGPTSALYGSAAIGGVINVITAPPEREGWSGRAQLEGRYRWGGFASGSGGYRDGDSWVVADGSFYGSEGVVLIAPDTAVPDLYRASVSLRAGTRLGRAVDSSVRVRYAREASQGVDGQEVPGLGTFLIDLPEVTDRLAVRVVEKITLGDGHSLSLSLASSGSGTRPDAIAATRRSTSCASASTRCTPARRRARSSRARRSRSWSAARGEVERFDQSLTRESIASSQVVTTSLVEVQPTQIGVGAAYAQVRTDPVEQLSIVAGGRVEGSDRYGVAAAPRLAVAARPWRDLTLRLSGGRGYRAPSAKEIGFVFDHSVFGYRVIGNPELLPETSWGLQADVEWRPHKLVQLRAAGFANWVDELIDLRAAGTSTIAGVDDYTYVNVGQARTSGAEARIRVRAVPWLLAEAGYSYLFTRDEEAQRPLPGRPPHTLLVSARAEAPIGLSFAGRLRVVTDAYIDDATRAPPFGVLDVRVAQKTWPGGEAYAGMLNGLGAEKDPLRFGDQRPVEGRTFYLGVSADLPPPEE